MIGRTSAKERALLVRHSVMAPSRIAALARARMAGLSMAGAACGASLGRIVARQDRMGEPRQDHGAQVSLKQYRDYTCV